MSIASQITTMQEHIEDIYDTFAVAGVDTSAAAKNIVNINANLKERLEYYLANGLDVVWNNWNKVSESGTTLSLNNTIQAKMDFVYKGNTSQSILPSGYTQVDYITSDGNSYIDTGKALGDKFKIETKFIHNQQSSNEQPIISTWVQSFQWFNLYISSNNQLRFYASGNHTTSNPTLTLGSINTVSYSRNSNNWVGVLNGETVTFDTYIQTSNPTTFKILARGDGTRGSYVSIYRLKLFENNILTMDLIPCYRNSDNVIGMYDIVNNIFYTNSGTGSFTYGSIAPNPECPIPVHLVTGDNEVKVEGKNLLDTSKFTTSTNITNIDVNTSVLNINGNDTNGWAKIFDNLDIPNGNYTIICQILSGTYTGGNLCFFDFNDTQYSFEFNFRTGGNTYNFTLTNGLKQLRIYAPKCSSNVELKIWFVKGTYTSSTIGNYQPYQSQTYPINLGSIELCKIGDYQDYIRKSIGKNLINSLEYHRSCNSNNGNIATPVSSPEMYLGIEDYVNVKPNTTYTVSFQHDDLTASLYIGTKDINGNFIERINLGVTRTFTTGSNVYQIFIFIYKSGGNFTIDGWTQLEYGNTATTYEPYGKVWYKYGAIGKKVYTGTSDENWIYYLHYLQISLANSIDWSGTIATQGKCNEYICRNRYLIIDTTYKKDKSISIGSNFLALYDSSFTDASTFKTWLSTHNLIVYYQLITPTITEITDTTLINQLEAIKLSYNEQTNISQTNTDKPFILDVTALKDLDAEDTTPTLATNRGLLFTQPPVSENFINDEDDNSILEETINEEEPNIEDDNREEEEPLDFFEKEIINNDEEQEEIPTEPIEIDNGQR